MVTPNTEPTWINRQRDGEEIQYEEQTVALWGFITKPTLESTQLPAANRKLLATFWYAKRDPNRYRNFGPDYQATRFADETGEPTSDSRVMLTGTDAKRFTIARHILSIASDEVHAAAMLDQVFRMTDDEVNAATPTVGTR